MTTSTENSGELDRAVKQSVREHYGDFARRSVSNCCGTDSLVQREKGANAFYTDSEASAVPEDAALASAACGNPTALATLQEGETVVDFGSGGGMDCFLAAQSVGPTGRVIGIDMTQEMIDLARKNATKVGIDNVEFHLAEIEHTPLHDGCADVVISNCVVCLAFDKDAVFAEAFRILRQGGRLFVSDVIRADDSPIPADFNVENWTTCEAPPDTKSEYLDRIRRSGFEDIDVPSEMPYEDTTMSVAVVSVHVVARKPLARHL